jgi:hypothetical protein
MDVKYNFNAEALPDPSEEDQQQLRELLPGVLDEGAMHVLVRVAPTVHAHYFVTRHPDDSDMDSEPGWDPSGVWTWDLERSTWTLLQYHTIVAAETHNAQHQSQITPDLEQ